MTLLLRIVLILLVIGLTTLSVYQLVRTLKGKSKKRFSVGILCATDLLLIYFSFFCFSPISPSISEDSFVSGVDMIIKRFADFNDNDEIEVETDAYSANIIISSYDSNAEAKKAFNDYLSSDYFLVFSGEAEKALFAYSKCFRPRNEKYLGVTAGSFGNIILQKDDKLIEINYYYKNDSFAEKLLSVVLPPETFYKETINLEELASAPIAVKQPGPVAVDWWHLD